MRYRELLAFFSDVFSRIFCSDWMPQQKRMKTITRTQIHYHYHLSRTSIISEVDTVSNADSISEVAAVCLPAAVGGSAAGAGTPVAAKTVGDVLAAAGSVSAVVSCLPVDAGNAGATHVSSGTEVQQAASGWS